MREIRTSGLMSGEGKRSDANAVQTTAPFLDSTVHQPLKQVKANLPGCWNVVQRQRDIR